MNNGNGFEQLGADINMAQALQAVQAQASAQSAGTLADPSVSSSSSTASGPASASSMSAPIFPPEEEARGLGAAPRKIDVSHFPHYGLKRGMACTFCRRRKLKCSGDRPLCTNCVKYAKVCEYGPPVKELKRPPMQPAGPALVPDFTAADYFGMEGLMPPPQHATGMFGAQPVIGMPPYIPDPNAGQPWMTAAQMPYALPPPPLVQTQSSASVSHLSGPSTPSTPGGSRPLASSMYQQNPSLYHVAEVSVVDGLTERLGEFLFSPNASAVKEDDTFKRRRQNGLVARGKEYDGLLEASRSLLLDCFLAHATLFFEMSVPRFRYRMTFTDRRRPSLALLNAMYLWATRISNSPQMSSMEKHFFELSCKHLDASTSTVDRLIDAVRAAMLLSAYSHSSGRHHEGWCLAGMAIRVVQSCGLHRIKSCVHKPEEPRNPFLRNRVFLLPPAEDAVELGERIHAFWAVFAIDRCGSLATGYPAGLRDEDITTPFGRHLSDIASGAVSERDDISVRDLYRGAGSENDTPYTKWIKCVAILERSTKMCFLDAAEDSPYTLAWNQYALTIHRDPLQAKPPEYLNQPKYRNPGDYRECLLAVEQLVHNLGDEGVFPVVRKMHAKQDGAPEPTIPPNILMLHHMIVAVHMVLHDINSLDIDNPEALKAARKSVLLFQAMPQIPFTDVDAFVVLVWSLIAKVLIKELHRLMLAGDTESAQSVVLEADVIIGEMARIGNTMYLARTQAKAMEELKNAALAAGNADDVQFALPQLETFMFPQPM